jgi:ATP synthase F1 complex assembly factor 1
MAFLSLYRKKVLLTSLYTNASKLTSIALRKNLFNSETISISPFSNDTNKEEMDELKKNPYFEKYAGKIAILQKTSPEELLSRLEVVEQANKQSSSKESGKDFSLPTKPKSDVSSSKASLLTKEKNLDAIMKIELLQDKSKDEISEIWRMHHLNTDAVSAVIPADVWMEMERRFIDYKTFLLPLPRKDGYEFIVVQFLGKSAHFTTLINFQAFHENAPECLTMDHYTELQSDKGIILMVGRYDSNLLTIQEAQCLANQVEMYYCNPSEEKQILMDTFKNTPNQFKHADLIAQLEKIDLLAAIPKKDEAK